jgi:hypothetical protein
MSRSVKRTPIIGNAASVSEAKDKAIAARVERRHAKAALAKGEQPKTHHKHRRGGAWNFAKDGRHWVRPDRRGYAVMGK